MPDINPLTCYLFCDFVNFFLFHMHASGEAADVTMGVARGDGCFFLIFLIFFIIVFTQAAIMVDGNSYGLDP